MKTFSLLRLCNNSNRVLATVSAATIEAAARELSPSSPLPLDPDGYARDEVTGLSYCVAQHWGTG